ncbi:MAG: hypothetical protein KatS3mg112_1413 [Thermogutta sp.]|nr:MAG: hypothetical protein KatS3mg112_1413 [Thermogutta sp.]
MHKTVFQRDLAGGSLSVRRNRDDPDQPPNPTPPESGGTDSGDSGRPQRPEVDLEELNRRLAEAVEQDADAWLDFS